MYNLRQLFENEMMVEEANKIAEEALNAACFSVQERLGVTAGDLAGVMFSGDDERQAFYNSMLDYIKSELYTLYCTFVESPIEVPDLNKVVGIQWDEVQPGMVYAGSYYIEIQNHALGKYELILGNWYDAIDDDLEALEVALFVWALGEGYKGLASHRPIYPNPLELPDEHRAELLAYIARPELVSRFAMAWTDFTTQDGTEYEVERVGHFTEGKFSWYAYRKGDPDIYNCVSLKEAV